MIEWIGTEFIKTLQPYTGQVVAYLMQFLSPLVLTLLTIGFALRGYATLRGATSEPLPEMMWEAFCKLLIVAIATNVAIYSDWIINTQNALTLQVAQQFAPAGSPMRTATNTWSVLQAFNDHASALTVQTFTQGVLSVQVVVALIALFAFSVGNAILLAAGMVVCAITGAFNSFLLGIGPLFITFLLLGQVGRQWFVNWLGTLLGMAVLTWLVFFLLGFSMSLTEQVVNYIVPRLGQINILTQSLIYVALCLCWVVMLWVAPSFANGLTGGAGIQMGTQLLTQVLMAMRMFKGNNPPPPSGAQNTAGRSHGWGYRAGAAVGNLTGATRAFQALAARGRPRSGP